MDGQDRQIARFIHDARRRLNRGRLVRSICLGLLVASGGAAAAAGAFVVAGYQVDRPWLAMPAAAGLLAGAAAFLLTRRRDAAATCEADRLFELKEGLISAAAFQREGRRQGLYGLQLEHTARRVSAADVGRIAVRVPRVVVAASALLVAATIWLCLLPDSPRVASAAAERRQNQQRSEAVARQLTDAADAILRDADEQDKKLLRESGVLQALEQFKPGTDLKEGLRQIARIRRQARETLDRNRLAREERAAAEMARDLAATSSGRDLAQRLDRREYAQAARELDKLKGPSPTTRPEADRQGPTSRPDSACRNPTSRPDNLNQCRQAMQRLKESAAAMAAACERAGQDCQLRQDARELNEAVCQAEQELAKACENGGQCDGEQLGQACRAITRANVMLDQLGGDLRQLEAMRRFAEKMGLLEKELNQCQSHMVSGQGMKQCGGPQWGVGVDRHERQGLGETARGLDTQLTGIRGTGPSTVNVLDTASGTGVSRAAARARAVDMQKQVESFVRRDDVPEELKSGVKNYFQSIHEPPAP